MVVVVVVVVVQMEVDDLKQKLQDAHWDVNVMTDRAG